MRVIVTILLLLQGAFSVRSQPSFEIEPPSKPIVAGDPFLVQYVLKDGDVNSVIQTPEFSDFRLISGPYMNTGLSGSKQVRSFSYTLVAGNPGTYSLPSAKIVAGGKLLRSGDARVQVITKQEAARLLDKKGNLLSSEYFLRPGEDPYKKIRENLFLKVQVDKHSCYVGEPVLAVYKLYSRLQSKSDIIKNPGFYGFTVYDMIGLADKEVTTEIINGRQFDVHTIRKVQLYPLQAGRFTIDAMEVMNRVEFSRSAVNKKTEQEIAEGMFGGQEEETVAEGTDVYNTAASTSPVEVEVKPLPEKTKPAAYSGAVGRFIIHAGVRNDRLARNEQGFYEITVEGAGNFTQLIAPVVPWPAGMEGFEPVVNDEFDKTRAPLTGSRTFRYPFICTSPGSYQIPAVSYSFFDQDSNTYKSLNAAPVKLEVSSEVKKNPASGNKGTSSVAAQNEKAARIAGLIAVAVVLLILAYWLFIRKDRKEESAVSEKKPVLPAAAELLQPAREQAAADDKSFYQSLQAAIWAFAAQRFGLSGSEMNKQLLSEKIGRATGAPQLSERLQKILFLCEAGTFTNASMGESREDLLQQVTEIFEKTDAALL